MLKPPFFIGKHDEKIWHENGIYAEWRVMVLKRRS